MVEKAFDLWTIKLDLPDILNPEYFFGKQKEKIDYINREIATSDEVIKKNYVKYLEFIDNIIFYFLKKNENKEINYRGKIILELTTVSEKQDEKIFENDDYLKNEKDNLINIRNVRCIYSMEKGEYKFIDDNVLIHGIDGKYQGFLFLLDEVCKDDYEL